MDGEAYLRVFGQEKEEKIPLEMYGHKLQKEAPLEIVNNIGPMKPEEIAQLKRIFDERAGSWLPLDRSGVWRYREFLPAFDPFYVIVSLSEGNTPIYPMKQCALFCGMDRIQAKHLGYNPTGSCKDHAMATAVTMAKSNGASLVACASAGPEAASMAAYAAAGGLQSIAVLPQSLVTNSNLSKCVDYNATTILIDGTLEQAQDIADTFASA
jgi:threonine synthase